MSVPHQPPGQIRVDMKFMFSDHKNVHRPRIEKRQRKLLQKIPMIGAFLEPDEVIRLVAPCVSPTSFFEQLTTGWIFAYLNRALLVVTNKGFFHIPSKMNYDYRHSISKLRYADLKKLRTRGRHLVVQHGDGRKEAYLYIPRAQRLKMRDFFKALNIDEAKATKGGKLHLCPRCTKALTKGVYQCPSCRLPFKDMATAMKLSWLIPGGGYFYTGHPILGIGDFFVELLLLFLVVSEIGSMIGGNPDASFGVFFFGTVLALEKLLTIHHARRYILEYIPKDKAPQLRPANAPVAQPATS